MPAHFGYVLETARQIGDLHRCLLMSEEQARAARRPRKKPTLEEMTAAAQRFFSERDEPVPDETESHARQVIEVARYFDEDQDGLRTFFEDSDVKPFAMELLKLSPSQLFKQRFETQELRRDYLGAALWYARKAFEWTYERCCEELLQPGLGYREHTAYAARMASRYTVRDGYEPLAMLPRFDRILSSLEGEERALYERWSVDYDDRARGAIEW